MNPMNGTTVDPLALLAPVKARPECHDGGVPTALAKVVCTVLLLKRTLAKAHIHCIEGCEPIGKLAKSKMI